MAHPVLDEPGTGSFRLRAQEPVGGGQKQQIVAVAVSLPGLEHGLAGRHDVAPVAVQENDPPKAVSDHVIDQVAQDVEVGPRCRRQCAREVEVMVRVAQPEQGRPDDPLAEPGAALRTTSPSNMLSVKTGRCLPCCSTAAMGKTTG